MDWFIGDEPIQGVEWCGFVEEDAGMFDNIADLVPVDMVANSSIVAGWMLAKDKPRDVFVVNMTSGQLNPITYDDCCMYY